MADDILPSTPANYATERVGTSAVASTLAKLGDYGGGYGDGGDYGDSALNSEVPSRE
jgi:hypothetical protein